MRSELIFELRRLWRSKLIDKTHFFLKDGMMIEEYLDSNKKSSEERYIELFELFESFES